MGTCRVVIVPKVAGFYRSGPNVGRGPAEGRVIGNIEALEAKRQAVALADAEAL